MKRFLKIVLFASLMLTCVSDASAQGLFKNISKFVNKTVDKTEKLIKPQKNAADSTACDSLLTDSVKAYKADKFYVKKVFLKDSLGNDLLNEDGTHVIRYHILDEEGRVCTSATAKKHLNAAYKAGAMILAKVGGGALAGALIGKKLKGGALLGAGVGAVVGLAASAKDFKKIAEHVKWIKSFKKVMRAYEKTFSVEGVPLQADVDLTNVDGINFEECGEISKTAQEVREELMASIKEGDTLEEVDETSLEEIEIPDDL